jgi:O-antigen ligase/tetratricopeptide (TPR) repeat protein
MCINACAMTILSLLQTFAGSRWLSEPWIVTNISSFGSFVNPNNAAGWLLVHMAIAIGLVVIAWGKTPIKGHSRPFGSSAWQERRNTFALSIRLRLASLNSRQVLSVVTVVLLLTGVAATVSRGGIVAAISCLLICAALRRSLLSLLSCSLLLAGVFFVLTALEFDSRVISELGTLESPLTEGISRTDHWSDSLTSVRDFPLLGSGQGAYAWSTRPYLRHGDLNWFRNADNQYVEVVVESGLLGLTFFVGFGIWLTVASIRLIAAETKTHPHQGWWPEPGGIGLAGLALITSQGIAVFFDFGIGHCSTIAAIAVVSGTLAAVVRSRRPSSQSAPAWYSPSGMLMGLSLRIAMVIAASTAVPELRHMDQIDPAITESARLLDSPVTRPALARLPVLNRQFSEALERYPDHPIVRMSLLRVVEARFRLQLIDQLSPVDAPLEDRELQNAWRQLTPVSLPDRIAIARTQLAPADFSHLQTSIKANLRDFPWHELARDMSRQMPLEPGIAVQSAAGYVSIGKLKDEQLQELNAVLFTDPAGARNLFLCGVLCLLEGRMQQTEAFWQQSLVVSERFRVAVLQNALRYLPQDQTLEMFAPREYLTTVNTALARISPELQAELFTLAESQWLSVRNNPTREQRVQRAVHLIHEEEPDVALKWIDGCLAEFPDLLELRPLRANCLEKQGKLGEAIGEWMRYEHFDPTNPQTAKTIKRLKKLQDN